MCANSGFFFLCPPPTNLDLFVSPLYGVPVAPGVWSIRSQNKPPIAHIPAGPTDFLSNKQKKKKRERNGNGVGKNNKQKGEIISIDEPTVHGAISDVNYLFTLSNGRRHMAACKCSPGPPTVSRNFHPTRPPDHFSRSLFVSREGIY